MKRKKEKKTWEEVSCLAARNETLEKRVYLE